MAIILLYHVFLQMLRGKAVLKIKQDGILAGITIAEKIFKMRMPLLYLLHLNMMAIR